MHIDELHGRFIIESKTRNITPIQANRHQSQRVARQPHGGDAP